MDFKEIKETKIVLKKNEKTAIIALINLLEFEDEADKIQNAIFNVAKNNNLKVGAFFKILYSILMGAKQGPRLGPYVLAMGKQNVIDALKRVSTEC